VSLLLEQRIAERVHREGPIPFDAFVEEALYGDEGFFTRARGAARRGGDFVTSPEVGTLFGLLVARALDQEWAQLGAPDPFFVVEAGAGRGRLAADILAASPRCAEALRYVLVERSDSSRHEQRELVVLEPVEDALGPVLVGDDDLGAVAVRGVGPIATSLAELPAVSMSGVVLANELLDNLPFRIVERTATGWSEVRVAAADGSFREELVAAAPEVAAEADVVASGAVAPGARLPVPTGIRDWLRACADVLERGTVIIVDYVESAAELAARGQAGWLRTYRSHNRGTSPLVAPGEQDITADVPYEYLVHSARRAGLHLERKTTQANWLRGLGIDDVVAEARAEWDARAHVGDLAAVKHRSRVTEGAALLDPTGLGAHSVLVLRRA
jgi:NADH dehydrogenase [ubiquinone] 1 alpha subcomplex assembly factor 7